MKLKKEKDKEREREREEKEAKKDSWRWQSYSGDVTHSHIRLEHSSLIYETHFFVAFITIIHLCLHLRFITPTGYCSVKLLSLKKSRSV